MRNPQEETGEANTGKGDMPLSTPPQLSEEKHPDTTTSNSPLTVIGSNEYTRRKKANSREEEIALLSVEGEKHVGVSHYSGQSIWVCLLIGNGGNCKGVKWWRARFNHRIYSTPKFPSLSHSTLRSIHPQGKRHRRPNPSIRRSSPEHTDE